MELSGSRVEGIERTLPGAFEVDRVRQRKLGIDEVIRTDDVLYLLIGLAFNPLIDVIGRPCWICFEVEQFEAGRIEVA
jgi:hypothetical protein